MGSHRKQENNVKTHTNDIDTHETCDDEVMDHGATLVDSIDGAGALEAECKVDSRFEVDDEFDSDSEEGDDEDTDAEEIDDGIDDDDEDDFENDDDDDVDDGDDGEFKQTTPARPLTLTALKKHKDKVDRTGVIYLSRIPPFMKPIKLRSLLTRYGEIGRIYLNPEDARIAARRRKYKHNKRQNYTEGWVEFLDKRVARQVAGLLNTTPMGGKKRGFYHDDLWNMKYLPKFKWTHLTEQLAYEIKVKEQRLKTEMAQAKRENKTYLGHVAKAKMVDAIRERKEAKRNLGDDGASDALPVSVDAPANATTVAAAAATIDPAGIRRRFKQRKVIDNTATAATSTSGGQSSSRSFTPSTKKASMLSKIFA